MATAIQFKPVGGVDNVLFSSRMSKLKTVIGKSFKHQSEPDGTVTLSWISELGAEGFNQQIVNDAIEALS